MIDTFRRPALSTPLVPLASRAPMANDLPAIGVNLIECRACQGRWFAWASAAEAVHHFLAPRLITTVVAALALWVVVAALA